MLLYRLIVQRRHRETRDEVPRSGDAETYNNSKVPTQLLIEPADRPFRNRFWHASSCKFKASAPRPQVARLFLRTCLFLVLSGNPMLSRMIDAEVGHDGNEDQAEDQAELEALEEEERSQGADFIDDSIMESGDMPNYNSTDIFGSDSESQAELEQLASAQRADQADGRPALDVSEAAAIRQAATGPQASTNSAEEAALDNAFGNSGAGGFVAPVPGFVQQAQAQAGQPELGIYPNWDPSDERITEIRCRQGTRGILVGDPANPISYFSGYISAIGESSDVSPTIMLGLERFAWAKNEKGHPVLIDFAGSLERGKIMQHLHGQTIFSAHVPTTTRGKELITYILKECLGINEGFTEGLKVQVKFFCAGQKAKEMFG